MLMNFSCASPEGTGRNEVTRIEGWRGSGWRAGQDARMPRLPPCGVVERIEIVMRIRQRQHVALECVEVHFAFRIRGPAAGEEALTGQKLVEARLGALVEQGSKGRGRGC